MTIRELINELEQRAKTLGDDATVYVDLLDEPEVRTITRDDVRPYILLI